MTAILTPALALRHLRQLSTDVRAAAVLAAPDLGVLAREGAGAPGAGDPGAPAGTVLAASDDQHVLAVLAGPHALLPLLRHDLATLLADLRAAAPDEGADASREAPAARVEVLERADSAVSAAIFAGLGIPATGKP